MKSWWIDQQNDIRLTVYSINDNLKGPFTQSDFKYPTLGSKKWTQAFRRSDFTVLFYSAPFIFQEERRMKIEHVLFPSTFQNYGSVFQKAIFNVSCLLCSRDPIFGTNKNEIIEIGSCEQALTQLLSLLPHTYFQWTEDKQGFQNRKRNPRTVDSSNKNCRSDLRINKTFTVCLCT